MRKLFAVLLLMTPVLCFARGKHAPLPDGVATAKTVYIVNRTGQQSVADGAYQAFTKWGMNVTTQKSEAQLFAVFTVDTGLVKGTTYPIVDMAIVLPDASDTAYQVTSDVHLHFWASAAKVCVHRFKKRVGAK